MKKFRYQILVILSLMVVYLAKAQPRIEFSAGPYGIDFPEAGTNSLVFSVAVNAGNSDRDVSVGVLPIVMRRITGQPLATNLTATYIVNGRTGGPGLVTLTQTTADSNLFTVTFSESIVKKGQRLTVLIYASLPKSANGTFDMFTGTIEQFSGWTGFPSNTNASLSFYGSVQSGTKMIQAIGRSAPSPAHLTPMRYGQDLYVRIECEPNRPYIIQRSSEVDGPWTSTSSPIGNDYGVFWYVTCMDEPQGFVRVIGLP